MELPFCLFNYQNGGRKAAGVNNFARLQLAFAEVATPPAIIVVNESKEWGFWDGAPLHQAELCLSRRFGRPYIGLLGWCNRGDYGPTIFYDATVLAVVAWYDGRYPTSDNKVNFARFVTRKGERLFGVVAQHWSYRSNADRTPEARLIAEFGDARQPIIVAGDLNGTASGLHLPQCDWAMASAKMRTEKGMPSPERLGEWTVCTEAVDFLIGSWNEALSCRFGGRNFWAVAELAYVAGDELAMTPTVNDGIDPGGSLLIDWILINHVLLSAGALVPGSYRVHIPDGPAEIWPSDHRLVSVTLRI